jgi:hypothetical protein
MIFNAARCPAASVVCMLGWLHATSATAQTPLPPNTPAAAAASKAVWSQDGNGQVTVRATRIAEPIRLDGRLDDEAYTLVPSISTFVQLQPVEGAPGTERTEAWVFFDDTHIYVSCRCWDANPERIVANEMRRDASNMSSQDSFGVAFDTFFDGRNGFQFYMSAAGGLRDGSVTDERFYADWNGVWDGRSTRFEGGWMAEIAIPFKTLRYGPGRSQVWRIQLRRLMAGKSETVFLTRLSPNWGFGAMNHFAEAATFVDLEVPPAARNVEIKPYAISRLTTDHLSRPAVEGDLDPDAGFDVKYGLTRGLIADFSFNTDFAQVEADENQVNLTRFSIQFPEKREFFLENQGLFQFGGGGGGDVGGAVAPTILYTRRIGLSGSRAVPVVGGGRLAGKAGAWSVGVLNILTDDDPAADVAQTNFSVVRVRRDILSRSNVGGIFTRRSVSTLGPGANDVWGLDANFAFYQNVYFSGYLARSRTEGLEGDDLSYRAQFNYNADRYGLAFDRLIVEDNFNPEVGFMRREDFRRSYAQARFSPRTTNHPIVRRWVYEAGLDYLTDNSGRLESRSLAAEFRTEFHSSDQVSVQYERSYELLVEPFRPPSATASVPAGGYDFDNLTVSYTLGAQHRIAGTPSFQIGGYYTGDKKAVGYRGRIEITPQLGVEPNISLNWIDLPEGSFRDTLISVRPTFTMTPRMFTSALVQYSSSNSAVSTNLRFRWEYQPGSELFLVYTEGRSTLEDELLLPRNRLGEPTTLQNRGFVVKINRLFRF